MGWILKDFECNTCGHIYESLIDSKDIEPPICPECECSNVKPLLSSPNIASFSIMSPADRATSLKKRSAAHSAKELASAPERFGKAGITQYTANKNKT